MNNQINFPYQETVSTVSGEKLALSSLEGKVLLVVNTASRCGFTGQYGDLQALQERFSAGLFQVIALPTNDFAWQEPLSDSEIGSFCENNYAVTYPVLAKSTSRGKKKSVLFAFIADTLGSPVWNFDKYLISATGEAKRRFLPPVSPLSSAVIEAISEELGQKA